MLFLDILNNNRYEGFQIGAHELDRGDGARFDPNAMFITGHQNIDHKVKGRKIYGELSVVRSKKLTIQLMSLCVQSTLRKIQRLP